MLFATFSGVSRHLHRRNRDTAKERAHGDRRERGGRSSTRRSDRRRLLELLVCPLTRDTLVYDAERQELISRAAKLAYPIRDGVPIMLPEEARKLED